MGQVLLRTPVLTYDQYAKLLDAGAWLNQREQAIHQIFNQIKNEEYRNQQINEVKDHFNQLKYFTWDRNIITQLICEYMPYEEKPTVIFGVKLW